jgi:hypothetical protein
MIPPLRRTYLGSTCRAREDIAISSTALRPTFAGEKSVSGGTRRAQADTQRLSV